MKPSPSGSAGEAAITPSSATTVRSQKQHIWVAPAMQNPCTAAITGFGWSQIRSQRSACAAWRSRSSTGSTPAAISSASPETSKPGREGPAVAAQHQHPRLGAPLRLERRVELVEQLVAEGVEAVGAVE
jgi:hypothetical protein